MKSCQKNNDLYILINKESTDRSIKDSFCFMLGSMTDEIVNWWKGLGEDLETDIETINESNS